MDQHDQADAAQLCVVGRSQHRAHDGTLVCTHHAQQLATWLRDVEDEAVMLDPRKSMAISSGGKGGSLASQQSPVRLDVLVLTDRRRNTGRVGRPDHDHVGLDDTPEVIHTLGTWAGRVRQERHLSAPAQVTVVGERRLLTAQLAWILTRPWVGKMHQDLHNLVQALRRANGTLSIAAGRCETIRNGTECGGTVFDVVIEHDDGPDEPGFRCDRCREVWLGTAAIRKRDQLARQIGGSMRMEA